MSSDEEDNDILNALVNNDSDSQHSSENEDENEQLQDEIVSDEEDSKLTKPKQKKQKKDDSFPLLEISEGQKEHDDDMYFINQEQQLAQAQGKLKAKGNFATFGFNKYVLSNINKKGYKQPTPIQRKTIPLILQGRDVVGMARTGSGKTAAFLLPLIEQLKTHSAKIGIRAIVLSPSRELALQTHVQLKEFSKGTGLRSLLLIGGDSMEDQFGALVSNPDIIIATPGRFMHLKVEMELDLKSVEYIVYDEADRLFEMGFAEQLNELLASLPEKRQSLLFSATLPRTLVDFAKAGLFNPVLVRLDAESKISDELELAFFSCKKNEREANLISILQDLIKIPLATKDQLEQIDEKYHEDSDDEEQERKKSMRKIRQKKANELPSEYSTIVFVPTRHHVEYITNILKRLGYPVSYIYGSLDQHARRRQLLLFRAGICSILVVTDVAARGIDIPVLANVINFSIPSSSKVFIHRVGRTARAGHKGWAYSIITENELPYLLDLELFLGRKILLTQMQRKKIELLKLREGDNFIEPKVPYSKRLVLGSIPRMEVEDAEEIFESVLKMSYDIKLLKGVCEKAEKLYMRTRQAATIESVKRSKELIEIGWEDQHLLFGKDIEDEKNEFLSKLQNRYNKETVFEFGKRDDSLIDLMNKRRRQIAPMQARVKERRSLLEKERMLGLTHTLDEEILNDKRDVNEIGFEVNNEELMKTFEDGDELLSKKRKTYKDANYFLPHYAPKSLLQDKQLDIGQGGGNFISEANEAAFDIDGEDDKIQVHKAKVQWDKKKGNYVKNQDDRKYIISESGQKIPASFKSGKYDQWRQKHNLGKIKVGGIEKEGARFEMHLNGQRRGGHKEYKGDKAPKMPMRGRDDFHKQFEKVKNANERGVKVKGFNAGGKNEIRSSKDIWKNRDEKEKKKAKNARPSKKSGGNGGGKGGFKKRR